MKMSKIWYTYLLFLNFFSAAWKKSVHQRDKQQEDDMLGKAFSVIKSWHFEIGAKWTIFMEIIPWKFDKTIHYSPIYQITIQKFIIPHFILFRHGAPWKSGSNDGVASSNMITVVSSKKGAMGRILIIYRFAIQCIAEIAVHWACSERKYQAWVCTYIM